MTAPANDNIAKAIGLVPGISSVDGFFIDDATTQPGEPGGINQTGWYVFYAYNNGTGIGWTTQGSEAHDAASGDGIPIPASPTFGSLNTFMNVWSAPSRYPSFSELTLVTSNDDSPTGGGRKYSSVTFSVMAGNYYFLQIGSVAGGYTGIVRVSPFGSGIPNSLPSPLTPPIATFVGATTSTMYVPAVDGVSIPVQMPSGIQKGDFIGTFFENIHVNPVSINGPIDGTAAWRGGLSTGNFFTIADGSEDGATLHWVSQATLPNTFPPQPNRVLVCIVVAYRLQIPPRNIFLLHNGASGITSATVAHMPGSGPSAGLVTSTRLLVYGAVGQRSDDDSDINASHPITGVSWHNPTPRTGLITLEWDPANNSLNDGTGVEVADVEYNFPPPFASYNPGDSVTAFGGAVSTALDVNTYWLDFPGYTASVAYWGINASTPT